MFEMIIKIVVVIRTQCMVERMEYELSVLFVVVHVHKQRFHVHIGPTQPHNQMHHHIRPLPLQSRCERHCNHKHSNWHHHTFVTLYTSTQHNSSAHPIHNSHCHSRYPHKSHSCHISHHAHINEKRKFHSKIFQRHSITDMCEERITCC